MNKPVPTQLAGRSLHPKAVLRQRDLFRSLDEALSAGNFFETSTSMIDKLRLLTSEYFRLLEHSVQPSIANDAAEGYR